MIFVIEYSIDDEDYVRYSAASTENEAKSDLFNDHPDADIFSVYQLPAD